uniref:BRCA2 DNA repair associated n=1 Tax=Cyprinodon variegatus TaxID=28743 RepID=A0A3Q2FTM6_CYPVA
MFDAFKDDIWKELGPVDPNWFEVLTAQASLGEGHVDDNDDLCANQEGLFKAPLEKTAVESQLFSTPKVFRRSQMVSPETEDEPSFTAAQGTVSSPCLFDYVKHISESLGAQINPDISWTSSFNTPPAMPSTLILCELLKHMACVVFPVAQHLPDSPLDQSGSHWQQKDPDTVKGEVSGAVGLKNASSDFHFFANSSSALRKVKPDRVKCKQITLTNEDACSHQAVSEADNGASSEEATTDLESGGLPATPLVKTGDSQWSPINLSEISSCAVSSSMTQPGDIDSVQHSRPSLKVTDTGFIRKRRQFVYTVATKTSQIKCHDSQSQKMDSSTKISEYGKTFNIHFKSNNMDFYMFAGHFVSSPFCTFALLTILYLFKVTILIGNPTINAEVSLHISTKDKNLDTGKGIDLHTESTSAGHSRSREETVDESNCSQLEKASIVPFANASGFKTASNKGIHISPANLERGKRFFEEADGEKTSHDLSITTPYAKNNKRNLIPETTKPKPSNSNLLPKVERPFVNINSHLTASEKADVTELCCLLEEADSQFEFTQFKPAKNLPNREYDFHTSPRQDKDLDPAFLQDIDFDDSFSSDCGKHPGVTLKSNSTLMHGQGFKTAGGVMLQVSKKSLSRARALFAELENNLTEDDEGWTLDSNSDASLEQTNKVSTKESGSLTGNLSQLKPDRKQTADFCEEPESGLNKANQKEGCSLPGQNGGFQTASGKTVIVSCEALSRAKLLSENNSTTLQFEATPKSLFNITRRAEVPDVLQTRKTDDKQDDQNKSKKTFCGFTTARGEKVNVSQKNLQKAKILFKEVSDLGLTKAMQDADISFRDDEGWILDGNSDASSEQTNKVSTKESGSITGNLSQLKPDRKQAAGICEEPESSSIKANQKEGCSMPGKNGGFQPASGNTVAISCEALLRPKLLSENKVDDDGICAPSQLSETPVSGPGLMNGGFFSASGKPVAISSEALQKAKALSADHSTAPWELIFDKNLRSFENPFKIGSKWK